MTQNNIKMLRDKKGLGRKALAKILGTSEQHLRRIEAGVQAVRFDLALGISDALEADVIEVFPAAKAALARASRGRKPAIDIARAEKTRKALEAAGFDMDPELWIFHFRLRGGLAEELFVSGPEKQRLWRLVQNKEGFAVFDSGNRRYAVNLAHLQFCQFLFEPAFASVAQAITRRADETRPEQELLLHFTDRPQPERFSVDRDTSSIVDADARDGNVQLQALFSSAETCVEDRFYFTDMDGEEVFFSITEVSMFSAPLFVVEPALNGMDEEDDGNEADENADGEEEESD